MRASTAEPCGECDQCGAPLYDGRRRYCGDGCRDHYQAPERAREAREAATLCDVGELLDHVVAAIEANDAARDESLPWRSSAWTFVMHLRAHPALVRLDADAAADRIEPVLETIDLDPNRDLPHPDEEDIWRRTLGPFDSKWRDADPLEDFLLVWERVHLPPLEVAVRRAAAPEYLGSGVFGPELSAPRRAPFRRFLAVARECCRLAEERGDEGVAPLALAAIAAELGTHRKTVGGWRREAERRGFLEMVREATPHGGLSGRAAEFRWVAREREQRTYEPRGAGGANS